MEEATQAEDKKCGFEADSDQDLCPTVSRATKVLPSDCGLRARLGWASWIQFVEGEIALGNGDAARAKCRTGSCEMRAWASCRRITQCTF